MGDFGFVLKSWRLLLCLRDDFADEERMMQKSIGIALVVAVLSGDAGLFRLRLRRTTSETKTGKDHYLRRP